jgi:hypothetical protein
MQDFLVKTLMARLGRSAAVQTSQVRLGKCGEIQVEADQRSRGGIVLGVGQLVEVNCKTGQSRQISREDAVKKSALRIAAVLSYGHEQ